MVFGSKTFFEPKFFWAQDFLDVNFFDWNIFWTQLFFEPTIFLDPTLLLKHIIFWTQHFLGLKKISDPQSLSGKTKISDSKTFSNPNFFHDPFVHRFLFSPKMIRPKKLFPVHEFIFDQKYSLQPKFFSGQKYFSYLN